MSSIVAVCGDPGGANALVPVLKLLKRQACVSVSPLAYNEAYDLWREQGIDATRLLTDITEADVLATIEETRLLLTGTSVNSLNLEKQFTAVARALGIPSLAVLDFWSNYRPRFADAQGNLAYLPNYIAVMDDNARKEMIEQGIDPSLLVVTGQPAFDDLAKFRQRFAIEDKDRLRQEVGARSDDLVLMFASQPFAQMYDARPDFEGIGFDEKGILTSLLEALERIARRLEKSIVLVIRPHPKERAGAFADLQSESFRIVVSKGASARELAMSADLVLGMNSNLLVEACYLGCIVVSLQPGLKTADVLPTNRLGFSRAVYHEADIEPQIERLLVDQEERRKAKQRLYAFIPEGGATERVTNLVYQMIERRNR